MTGYKIILITVILGLSNCFADTFLPKQGGRTFDGYATSIKKGALTQVRIAKRSPKFLDLNQYRIEPNAKGRQDKMFFLPITRSLPIFAEADAFEEMIKIAVNQGPYFIVIEIDSAGGRLDIAERLYRAIEGAENCTTVAWISGSKQGGAFAEAAILALACDKVYIKHGAKLGGRSFSAAVADERSLVGVADEQPLASRALATWLRSVMQLSTQGRYPRLLVDAMSNDSLEVVEVDNNSESVIKDGRFVNEDEVIERTLSRRGSLLQFTAGEALKYEMVDGVARSLNELITSLGGAKARQIRDTKMTQAYSNYQRGRNSINRNLTSIDGLNKRAAADMKQMEKDEKTISELNEMSLRRNYGILRTDSGRLREIGMSFEEWENLLARYDDTRDGLLDTYNRLIAEYRKAIPIAKRYPDLEFLTDIFSQAGAQAVAAYDDIESSVRFGYSDYNSNINYDSGY